MTHTDGETETETDADVETETAPTPIRPPIPVWLTPLLGIVAVGLGFLPWIAAGLRLPIQVLWAAPTAPEDMPIVLLPFDHYSLSLIFGLLVVSSAFVGITARALRPHLRRGGFTLLQFTAFVVQILAIAQTALVVRDGLQERTESLVYLAALVGVSAVSLFVGVFAQILIASAPRAGALLGLTVGAIAAYPWVSGFFRPLLLDGPSWIGLMIGHLHWVTPVLTGIAIAWAGINTVGRVLAAILSLALLWIAPAAMTGVANAAASRVLARDIPALIDYALGVFGAALFVPELALRPIIAAVLVAAVGLTVRWLVTRRRRRRAAADPHPVTQPEA